MTTWPEIVGYRHEILHTGVLAHLLNDPARGAAIAVALTGADVKAVSDVRTEQKVDGYTGKADLVAGVELVAGQSVTLAVETKVDSDVDHEQLEHTAGAPHIAVLLSLGVTALKMTARDLGEDLTVGGWRVVDPAAWAGVLDQHIQAEDSLLGPYVAEVQREAVEHARARELAYRPEFEEWLIDGSRRGDWQLEHYAWLAEIRERLPNPDEWWVYEKQSGPLMGLWREEFQRGGRSVFIEFVCTWSQRSLRLKIGAGEGELADAAAAALARVCLDDWSAGRSPQAGWQTCTAAILDLSDAAPDAAAERTLRAIAAIAA